MIKKGAVNLLSNGTLLPSDAFLFFSHDNYLGAHVCTVGKVGRRVKVSKFEQNVDRFDVSVDRARSGVVVKHELLHETCDDPLVSWLAATRILNAMLACEVQIHSLPKSCGLNFRI